MHTPNHNIHDHTHVLCTQTRADSPSSRPKPAIQQTRQHMGAHSQLNTVHKYKQYFLAIDTKTW